MTRHRVDRAATALTIGQHVERGFAGGPRRIARDVALLMRDELRAAVQVTERGRTRRVERRQNCVDIARAQLGVRLGLRFGGLTSGNLALRACEHGRGRLRAGLLTGQHFGLRQTDVPFGGQLRLLLRLKPSLFARLGGFHFLRVGHPALLLARRAAKKPHAPASRR